MRYPVIDLGSCNLCGGCMELCPEVFCLNQGTGFVEVADLRNYPEAEVDEAIKNCPLDCISWEG
jgi:ferredoxin